MHVRQSAFAAFSIALRGVGGAARQAALAGRQGRAGQGRAGQGRAGPGPHLLQEAEQRDAQRRALRPQPPPVQVPQQRGDRAAPLHRVLRRHKIPKP